MRKKLKAARQAARLTQQEMAKQLGVGVRHYKKLESGDTIGSISVWDTLEDILGISQRVLRENYPDIAGNQ